jgi:acetyl-CoA carboxylase biotin carboxyl carrier protein
MAEHQGNGVTGTADVVVTRELLAALRSAITELVAAAAGPVAEVSARAGDCELQIRWDRAQRPAEYRPEPAGATGAGANGAAAALPPPAVPDPAVAQPAAESNGYRCVTAPIVGTFYRAPQPGAEPFVEPGQRVEVGQTLAIVEAMKLMNPVKSEWAGTVREVLVADGHSVEFGQPLMFIDDATE